MHPEQEPIDVAYKRESESIGGKTEKKERNIYLHFMSIKIVEGKMNVLCCTNTKEKASRHNSQKGGRQVWVVWTCCKNGISQLGKEV